ncbi:hypothetical protein IMCC3135_32660 [Granulosicoccus antarcticus IMCC3135]|uniref:Lipoprotein n=2 Tax=Granulosicoccus TaxID=437504 RepID=A0A2Z2P7A7_9GAMM|nr:hypothetical protein IMCC3135_32660 [Granulosicoccus antarcticus IMCC3135]
MLLSALLGLLASGCASTGPSFGDTVMAEGNAVADIGEQWEEGQALIRKGNKKVSKGNDQISEGKENLADGTSMVKSGEKLVRDAEKKYEQSRVVLPAK